jgi:hypothetical protein
MKYLKSILMTFSFFVISLSAHAQIATLDGNWHSPQWKYGYVLKDGMGIATSTNSPNFQAGQNIIQLTATSPNAFTGQQVYTDGKFYKVAVKLQADGLLYFDGEKNVQWVMERIGDSARTSNKAVNLNNNSRPQNLNPKADWEDMGNGFEVNRYSGHVRVRQ